MNNAQKNRQAEGGFTLVELAIVMIIIGLLIAGVLKGQELIGNARVTATVAQIKSIDAAVSTFKDTYQNLPGDMVNPTQRLPSCLAAPCGFVGNGDGQLATTPGAVPGGEATAFFPQLSVANLITGLSPVAGGTGWNQNFPATKIGSGGWQVGYTTAPSAATLPGTFAVVGTNAGLFLAALPTVNTAMAVGTTSLLPKDAGRIDTKLDDGAPGSGDVVGVGTQGIAIGNCGSITAGAVPGTYATANTQASCGLYVHIQG
jgi:prepilin-type N-terminal cleavage/methylation domain-containing protein